MQHSSFSQVLFIPALDRQAWLTFLYYCVRERESVKKEIQRGRKRKDVNYLTPNMGDDDLDFEEVDPDEVVISIAVYHHRKQLKIHVSSRRYTNYHNEFHMCS